MSKHNHPPWPKYRLILTKRRYRPELVDEIMAGLVATWDCPVCKKEETQPSKPPSKSRKK